MKEIKAKDGAVFCPKSKGEISINECEKCPFFAVKIMTSSEIVIDCKFESQK